MAKNGIWHAYWGEPNTVEWGIPQKRSLTKSTHMGKKGCTTKTKAVLKPVNQGAFKLGGMQSWMFQTS